MILGIVIILPDVVLMTVVIVLILTVRVCVTIGLITGQIMDSGIMIWVTSCNCKINAYDYGEQGPAGCDHNSSERTCRSYG